MLEGLFEAVFGVAAADDDLRTNAADAERRPRLEPRRVVALERGPRRAPESREQAQVGQRSVEQHPRGERVEENRGLVVEQLMGGAQGCSPLRRTTPAAGLHGCMLLWLVRTDRRQR